MNTALKSTLSGLVLGLSLLTVAHAGDTRYISIRNTDTVWVPGNICVYQFRLDNGGSGEGFGPLTLLLQLKDAHGRTRATGEMNVPAFGDSDATRTQDAALELDCVDGVSAVEIIKATEGHRSRETNLPLSVFDPLYYRPLPVSVSGKTPV